MEKKGSAQKHNESTVSVPVGIKVKKVITTYNDSFTKIEE